MLNKTTTIKPTTTTVAETTNTIIPTTTTGVLTTSPVAETTTTTESKTITIATTTSTIAGNLYIQLPMKAKMSGVEFLLQTLGFAYLSIT